MQTSPTSSLPRVRHITGIVRDPVVIGEDAVIDGVIQASVAIRGPVTVTLRGTIQGSTRVSLPAFVSSYKERKKEASQSHKAPKS